MGLPAAGSAWPPKPFEHVARRLESYTAWYTGDPDLLAQVYGEVGGLGFGPYARQQLLDRPSQYRGGVVGWFARLFWGTPLNPSEKRSKLHVPIAADMARTSAELLFSEPPKVTAADADTATQDRLDELIDDGMHATLLEGGELCAAHGTAYLRACWNKELRDKPWLTAVAADQAIPEWRWGDLAAVTFWRVIAADGNRIIRHLERHEPGHILNAVYQGSLTALGDVVDLGGFPETKALLPDVLTGIPKITAEAVPNMMPNRVYRNMPAAAGMGRSDFAGLEYLMDALDEAYSSWMRDVRLGKSRIVVAESMLQSMGQGQGARWDPDREIYEGLEMMLSPGQSPVTHIQPTIRHAEHQATTLNLLEQILRGGGYSTQTFGLGGDVAVTATEVDAKERSSITTRTRKSHYWSPRLASMHETLLMLDDVVFHSGVTPVRPDVEWGDYVGQDRADLAQTAQLLFAAEAASLEQRVRLVNPEWDDPQIDEEVARIKDEQQAANPIVPGPADLGMGGPGPGPGAQDPAMNGAGGNGAGGY